jgi:hypothetical protein
LTPRAQDVSSALDIFFRGIGERRIAEDGMKVHWPWRRSAVAPTTTATPAPCTHPRVEVEMHGTAVKRRWCAVCGQELPVGERVADA